MIPLKQGRIGVPLTLSILGELTHADVARLATEPQARLTMPPVQKIRAVHHAAARLLAAGKSAKDTAILVGYTPQRIRDLCNDPAFKDLLHTYGAEIRDAEIEDQARLRQKAVIMAEDALDEIQERLDDPAKRARMPTSELRQIMAEGLNRTVLPPKTAAPLTAPPAQITFNIAGTLTPPPAPEGAPKVLEHDPEPTDTAKASETEAASG